MAEVPSQYTTNPIGLLWREVVLFIRLTLDVCNLSLVSIVWPIWPIKSDSDELAPTCGDVRALCIHSGLFIAQVIFLALVVVGLILPIWPIAYLVAVAVAITLNTQLCLFFLNSSGKGLFYAGAQYAQRSAEEKDKLTPLEAGQEGERWVFINGVAVGSHWMKSNLDLIAKTFRRPVLGIHNPTYGIIFDVLECVVQRTFSYPTRDIRRAYDAIRKLADDDAVLKVVLIAHSQGAIEASLVLDWLYATISTKSIAKIEVYTFGNAANHWNLPVHADGRPCIKHIEHYVNSKDWVSRFGVLSVRGRDRDSSGNRFAGKLFLRSGSGHLLNQHYLNNMFPTSESPVLDGRSFMECTITNENFSSDGADVPLPGALLNVESQLWRYREGEPRSS